MAWFDDEKAYDMVPQIWIIGYLKIYKISDGIIRTNDNTMKNWRVEFTLKG